MVTDVSEEQIASIFTVKMFFSKGTKDGDDGRY
jgi:hypothetical protein